MAQIIKLKCLILQKLCKFGPNIIVVNLLCSCVKLLPHFRFKIFLPFLDRSRSFSCAPFVFSDVTCDVILLIPTLFSPYIFRAVLLNNHQLRKVFRRIHLHQLYEIGGSGGIARNPPQRRTNTSAEEKPSLLSTLPQKEKDD